MIYTASAYNYTNDKPLTLADIEGVIEKVKDLEKGTGSNTWILISPEGKIYSGASLQIARVLAKEYLKPVSAFPQQL